MARLCQSQASLVCPARIPTKRAMLRGMERRLIFSESTWIWVRLRATTTFPAQPKQPALRHTCSKDTTANKYMASAPLHIL